MAGGASETAPPRQRHRLGRQDCCRAGSSAPAESYQSSSQTSRRSFTATLSPEPSGGDGADQSELDGAGSCLRAIDHVELREQQPEAVANGPRAEVEPGC